VRIQLIVQPAQYAFLRLEWLSWTNSTWRPTASSNTLLLKLSKKKPAHHQTREVQKSAPQEYLF
jgi:hypothetical protein